MDEKWRKTLQILLGIALLFLLRKVLGRIALLLLVSATLAYLIHPLMRLFQRRLHLGERIAAALAFALAAIAVSAAVFFGIPLLLRQIEQLRLAAPQLLDSFRNALTGATHLLQEAGLPDETLALLRTYAADALGTGFEALATRLSIIIQDIKERSYLIFSPLLAYYMLRDKQRLFNLLTRLIPSRMRANALRIAHAIQETLCAYRNGQLLVSAITGTLTGLGLLLIGLPSWLIMGIIMSICNLIPFFGPWLGAIPVVLFSAGNGLFAVLGGLLVVFLAQQIEGFAVTPYIIGDAARLHPAFVILALITGGWIAGLPGMFYSIPAVISIRAAVRTLRDARLKK